MLKSIHYQRIIAEQAGLARSSRGTRTLRLSASRNAFRIKKSVSQKAPDKSFPPGKALQAAS
jgi:hypothetical protein